MFERECYFCTYSQISSGLRRFAPAPEQIGPKVGKVFATNRGVPNSHLEKAAKTWEMPLTITLLDLE